VSELIDPLSVAWKVSQALTQIGVVHTIGGSLAASFAGEPRTTIDIDIVAAIEEFHVDRLVAALTADYYVDDASLRRAVRERGSTNLIHHRTQLKVDLFVAGGTPLDAQQLQKLRWYLKGGKTSDRQWRDIRGIIRVQGARLDREYLREHAPALGIGDLLAKALTEGGLV
jgi:hypothetical protein